MNELDNKIEMLTREVERWAIIVEIRDGIDKCDERSATGKDCDVCLGMSYAINIIKRRMENE